MCSVEGTVVGIGLVEKAVSVKRAAGGLMLHPSMYKVAGSDKEDGGGGCSNGTQSDGGRVAGGDVDGSGGGGESGSGGGRT